MSFKPATCPNCAGNLQLPDERDTVNCMYCGTSIVVREAIRAAAAGSVPNLLKLADTAVESGNFQEAFGYYTRVLEADAGHAGSWYGKGCAAGSLSSPHQFRIPEMLACFRAALEHTAEGPGKSELRRRVAASVVGLGERAYRASEQQIGRYAADDGAWAAHLEQSGAVLRALEFAHGLDPECRRALELIVHLCGQLRQGIYFHAPGRLDHRNRPLTMRREVSGEYLAWLKKLEAYYGPKLRASAAEAHPPAPKPFGQFQAKPVRRVSLWLGVGIFIMPYAFAWLTLREGHSRLARGVSFGWLALFVLANISSLVNPPAPRGGAVSPAAPAAATATPSPSPTPLSSAEKLARAKRLAEGEPAGEQMSQALALLQAVPPSDRESKEARALEARLKGKLARVLAEEAVLGPAPENSAWDGSVRCVDKYLKETLNDYDAAEYLEWSKVAKTYVKGEPFWVVRLKLRAPNAFGAKIIKTPTFFIRRGSVVAAEGL